MCDADSTGYYGTICNKMFSSIYPVVITFLPVDKFETSKFKDTKVFQSSFILEIFCEKLLRKVADLVVGGNKEWKLTLKCNH